MFENQDLGPFDVNNSDNGKINNGIAVPCRICEVAFRRLTLTMRYCGECNRGFCEGQHGNFAPHGHRGICVRCGPGP